MLTRGAPIKSLPSNQVPAHQKKPSLCSVKQSNLFLPNQVPLEEKKKHRGAKGRALDGRANGKHGILLPIVFDSARMSRAT